MQRDQRAPERRLTLTGIVIAAMLLMSTAEPSAYPWAATMTFRTSDGVESTLRVTNEEAERDPEWIPEEGQPAPLPIKLAIDLARDSVQSENPTFSELDLTSIELRRADGRHRDRWYYIVYFNPVVEGRTLRGPGYVALVLMDGTVKAPEVTSKKPAG